MSAVAVWGQGAGTQEERAVHGRWEKRGWGDGFPREQETGSGEKSHNTAQYFPMKKVPRGKSQQSRVGTGIKGYGKWEV